MTDQLRLQVESELRFIAVCVWCGEAIAAVPVEPSARSPGGDWGAAEKWCYIAVEEHKKNNCPKKEQHNAHR